MTGPAPHRFETRVWYEDTDLGGIVYHANYLKFIERARSTWVRELGIDQNALRASGRAFAVAELAARFLAPARLDDVLVVTTRAIEVRPARMVLDQRIARGEVPLFSAEVTLVCLGPGGRPVRLPGTLRALGPVAGGGGPPATGAAQTRS
ncbi:tol-pal system-associated acyl-CoA thioesterase [Wenxinia saemankumensis]|uniref:Acyl-CoA thioester hydrolase n=1 Tax=Wenxinia saemankumensis TaxID=1447782 RepID=A0A1M6C047_9RHOB|nr:tol-pal system-associated acyl-CoA thioesterase [Wenxinia saemankumensis]SHI54058.1 acyl-CoA thioester hydrolase [Wenxinia saemankumensis]